MASTYGLNFGFRISDESRRWTAGRWRTPATGSALLLGTAVEQDPAAPTVLKVSAANAKLLPGVRGLLLQEEFDYSIYETDITDSFTRGVAKLNRLSVVTGGEGVKIWLKNTAGSTRADGRVIPAVTMFDATSVAVGRGLAWDGSKWVDVADPFGATSWMTVTSYNATTGRLEAVLNK